MGRIRKPPKINAPIVALSKRPDVRSGVGVTAAEFTELELEIIRRLLEKQEPRNISTDLGLAANDLDVLFASPRFQHEYELQTRLVDRGIRTRMERLTSEALDVLRDIMRTAVSPGNRLRAALEILDRSGYVKVEKRLTVTADAESIIRELNRLGSTTQQIVEATPETIPPEISEEITDAEYVEIAGRVVDAETSNP